MKDRTSILLDVYMHIYPLLYWKRSGAIEFMQQATFSWLQQRTHNTVKTMGSKTKCIQNKKYESWYAVDYVVNYACYYPNLL